MGKLLKIGAVVVSWPLLALVLYVTGDAAPTGVRWVDANVGRAEAMAATLKIWMFVVLLITIWTIMFSVIVPTIERRRLSERNGQSERGRQGSGA
jgi:hypothetical protein